MLQPKKAGRRSGDGCLQIIGVQQDRYAPKGHLTNGTVASCLDHETYRPGEDLARSLLPQHVNLT